MRVILHAGTAAGLAVGFKVDSMIDGVVTDVELEPGLFELHTTSTYHTDLQLTCFNFGSRFIIKIYLTNLKYTNCHTKAIIAVDQQQVCRICRCVPSI